MSTLSHRLTASKKWPIVIVFLGALLIVFCRAFFGFDWSDETYYSSSAHQILLSNFNLTGNHNIHQFSSLLLAPLIGLYQLIFGSLDGVILGFRLLFIVLLLGAAALVFTRLLQEGYQQTTNLGAAIFVLLFAPACIATLSYNTLPLELLIISVFLPMWLGRSCGKQKITAAISGFLLSMAVVCYPTYIIVIPVYLVYFSDLASSRWKMKKISGLVYVAIGALCALAIFSLVFLKTPAHEFLRNVTYMLRESEHPRQSLVNLAWNYLSGIRHLFGDFIIILYGVVTVLLVVHVFRPKYKCKRRESTVLRNFAQSVLFLLFLGSVLRLVYLYDPAYVKINYLCAVISAQYLPLRFSRVTSERKLGLSDFLFLLGLFSSLAIHLATNNGFVLSSSGLLLSAIATFVEFGNYAKHFAVEGASVLWIKVVTRVFVLVSVILLAVFHVTGVYRDSELSTLNTRMKSGPAAGIYTNETAARKYETVISEIETYVRADESNYVLFSKLLPFGYIHANKLAGAPSTARYSLQSMQLTEYYKNYENRIPGVVFVLADDYGVSNDDNPNGGFFAEKSVTGVYIKRIVEAGIVYTTSSNPKKE